MEFTKKTASLAGLFANEKLFQEFPLWLMKSSLRPLHLGKSPEDSTVGRGQRPVRGVRAGVEGVRVDVEGVRAEGRGQRPVWGLQAEDGGLCGACGQGAEACVGCGGG